MRVRTGLLAAFVGLTTLVFGAGNAVDFIDPVAITSPAENEFVSGVVNVAMDVAPEFNATLVSLRVDGVEVGTDTAAPWEISWDSSSGLPGTAHDLVARAYGTAQEIPLEAGQGIIVNRVYDSPAVSVRLSGVSVVSHTTGSAAFGVTEFVVEALHNDNVAKVELYVDGVKSTYKSAACTSEDPADLLLGSCDEAEATADPAGKSLGASLFHDFGEEPALTPHTIEVKMTTGAATPATVWSLPIVVNIAGVGYVAPVDGGVVSGVETLEVAAAVGFTTNQVEFFLDNIKIGTDDTAPFTATWDTDAVDPDTLERLFAVGSRHKLHARATGLIEGEEVPVVSPDIFVNVAGIAITTPGDGLSPKFLEAEVDAGDADGITKVEVLFDGNVVGTDTSAPYQLTIDTSAYHGQTVSMTARMTDALDNTQTSDGVSLDVDAVLPDLNVTNPQEGDLVLSLPPIGDPETDPQLATIFSGTASDTAVGDSGLTNVAVNMVGNTGTTRAGTATLLAANGWKYQVPFILLPGLYVVTISAADVAGNVSAAAFNVVVI